MRRRSPPRVANFVSCAAGAGDRPPQQEPETSLASAERIGYASGLEVGVMGGIIGASSKATLGRKRTATWVGSRTLLPTVGLAFLAACTNHPDDGTPVSPGTGVTRAPGGGQKVLAKPARPIMGGTL